MRRRRPRDSDVVKGLKDFLTPETDVLHHRGVAVAGYYSPAGDCGGDWWVARPLSDDRLAILIADVKGHGVEAATLMGIGKAVFELACLEPDLGPHELLAQMNPSVHAAGHRYDMHMTCFVAIVDGERRRVEYASAGHTIPLCLRGGGTTIVPLIARSTPLGLEPTWTDRPRTLDLDVGDLIFFYTDGVTECQDAAGKAFGDRRLLRLLRAHHDGPVATVRSKVVDALAEHAGGVEVDDDVTFVVAQLDGGYSDHP